MVLEVWLDKGVDQTRSLERGPDLALAFTKSLIAARCNLAVATPCPEKRRSPQLKSRSISKQSSLLVVEMTSQCYLLYSKKSWNRAADAERGYLR